MHPSNKNYRGTKINIMSACSENSPASENKQCAHNPTSASQETDWTVKIQNKRLHLRTAWARRRSASRRRAAAALCKRSPARQRAAERRAEHSTTTRVSSRWESLEKVLSHKAPRYFGVCS